MIMYIYYADVWGVTVGFGAHSTTLVWYDDQQGSQDKMQGGVRNPCQWGIVWGIIATNHFKQKERKFRSWFSKACLR